jgi:hypothetical protein
LSSSIDHDFTAGPPTPRKAPYAHLPTRYTKKYRLNPIYTIPLFSDLRKQRPPLLERGTVLHVQIQPHRIKQGYLMTDLFLQDLKELSSKKLDNVLLNERKRMLGEQESHLNKTGDTRLFLNSLAGLIITFIKDKGGENVTK